jgi:uncharacterized YigZ family protein
VGLNSYRVLAGPVRAAIEEKRSRFLCLLVRVSTEDEARAVVEAARREFPDARHHCSAYVLGVGAVERSSDDGEPSGTAGAPMLEVLRGAGVGDVVAVVVRWFGGTLLGAGGLVRAYGDAVRAALDEAVVVERRRLDLVTVTVGHSEAGRLENDLRARGVTVQGTTYGERVTLTLAVPTGAPISDEVAALTGGAAEVTPAGETWVDVR